MMKDRLLELSSNLHSLPRKVLDQNMFVLLGKAKELDAEAYKIESFVKLEFPDLVDDRNEKDTILTLESYNKGFWSIISSLTENLLSLLKGQINEEKLQKIEEKLMLLEKLLLKRSEISKISDLTQLLKDSLATEFDIQVLIEPYTAIYSIVNKIIEERRNKNTVIISMKELLKELSSRLPYSFDIVKIEKLLESEYEEKHRIIINHEEYIFTIPYDTIIRNLLNEVPKDPTGITYLELLKKTNLPKDLFDTILKELEKEGRLIKDETAESGERLYFPELY